MPIAQQITYKCPKCGFTITKTIGDVINPLDLIPPTCPKCGQKMIKTNGIIESIKKLFE